MIITDFLRLDHNGFRRPTFPKTLEDYDLSVLISELSEKNIHTHLNSSYTLVKDGNDFSQLKLSQGPTHGMDIYCHWLDNHSIIREPTYYHSIKESIIHLYLEFLNFKPVGSQALVRPAGIECNLKIEGQSKYHKKMFQIYKDAKEVIKNCNLIH